MKRWRVAISEYGIDITRDPLPVVPAAHYSCGGVWIDLDGKTTVDHTEPADWDPSKALKNMSGRKLSSGTIAILPLGDEWLLLKGGLAKYRSVH